MTAWTVCHVLTKLAVGKGGFVTQTLLLYRRLYILCQNLRVLVVFSSCSSEELSLTERRKFHTILQTYKVLHKLAPDYLHGIFEYAVNVTGRISRNAHRLFVPQLRTNYGKRSLYYRGTILWNALPAALYHVSTLFQFRSSYLEQYNCS